MFVREGGLANVEPQVDEASWFLSLSEGDLSILSVGKAARQCMVMFNRNNLSYLRVKNEKQCAGKKHCLRF